jgi:hypothetical protein
VEGISTRLGIRVQQIIPAEGWTVVFMRDDGPLFAPLAAWGILMDGTPVGLYPPGRDTEAPGGLVPVDQVEGFHSIIAEAQVTPQIERRLREEAQRLKRVRAAESGLRVVSLEDRGDGSWREGADLAETGMLELHR